MFNFVLDTPVPNEEEPSDGCLAAEEAEFAITHIPESSDVEATEVAETPDPLLMVAVEFIVEVVD